MEACRGLRPAISHHLKCITTAISLSPQPGIQPPTIHPDEDDPTVVLCQDKIQHGVSFAHPWARTYLSNPRDKYFYSPHLPSFLLLFPSPAVSAPDYTLSPPLLLALHTTPSTKWVEVLRLVLACSRPLWPTLLVKPSTGDLPSVSSVSVLWELPEVLMKVLSQRLWLRRALSQASLKSESFYRIRV